MNPEHINFMNSYPDLQKIDDWETREMVTAFRNEYRGNNSYAHDTYVKHTLLQGKFSSMAEEALYRINGVPAELLPVATDSLPDPSSSRVRRIFRRMKQFF